MATSTEDMNVPEGFLVAPRVPQGLAAAVEGLTREVIRHRPEDIYVFAAHHFEKLLHIREQYGVSRSLSVDEKNLQALRDMSEVLRRRDAFKEEKNPRDLVYQSGWSLNETAKVLDRHRSIFGDEGRKISTEEVRELASEKEKRKSEHFGRHRTPEKRTSRRKEDYRESPGMKNGPKIISQIPTLPGNTVKDIKSELRKNMISSKERRNLRNQMSEMESEVLKSTSRRSLEKSERIERSERSERKQRSERRERTERIERKEEKRKNTERKGSRGLSMDRVKDYVVQKFATTKSLEELQSPTYVEKVQEVIDETTPIIKEKVEELKNSLISKRNFSKENSKSKEYSKSKEESVSKEISKSKELKGRSRSNELKESSKSNESKENSRSRKVKKRSQVSELETPNDSLEDVETLKSEVESLGSKNALETRLNETQTLLEGISSSFTIPVRRSNSAKDLRHRLSEASDVSLPVVRPFSSKSHSRSVSRTDSDNLVLPPISPEVTKSTKVKEELVLPVLSTPGSASNLEGMEEMRIKDEEGGNDKDVADERDKNEEDDTRDGSDGEENDAEKIMVSREEERKIIEAENYILPLTPKELRRVEAEVEEVFKDSLNVTPEPLDVPQRPDSLEPEEEVRGVQDGPSGLREKLLEIQKVEKEIESLLDSEDKKVFEDKDQAEFSIRDKLQEVEDSERRIEDILGEGKVELGVSVKEKLKELEEVEKRIETFLDEPIRMESLNPKDEVERIEIDSREEEKKAICKTLENEKMCEVGVEGGEEIIDFKGGEKEEGKKIMENKRENEENKEREKEKKSEIMEKEEERAEDKLNMDEEEDDSNSSSKKSIPFSYVLTEGSPYEIPDSVTTVIIPDRIPSPDSDILEIEVEDDEVRSKLIPTKRKSLEDGDHEKKLKEDQEQKLEREEESLKSSEDSYLNLEVFGEAVQHNSVNNSLIDIDLLNIKVRNDLIIPHQDLDQIKEEDDKDLDGVKEDEKEQRNQLEKIKEEKDEMKEEANEVKADPVKEKDHEDDIDEEELKVLKVMTAALKEEEEKLKLKEKNKPQESEDSSPEVLRLTDSESTDETKETSITDGVLEVTDNVENSLEVGESTGRSIESSNEVKETTMTDQSNASFSFDPGMPIVPELNLDSLQDLTVSSFKMTDEETEKRESEETESVVSITEPESEGKDENGEEKEDVDLSRSDGETKVKKVESKDDKEENLKDSGREGSKEIEDQKGVVEEKVKDEVLVEMIKERKDDKELGIEERVDVPELMKNEEVDVKERLEVIRRMEKQQDEIMKSVEAVEKIKEEKMKENVELQEENLKEQVEVKRDSEDEANLTDSETETSVQNEESKEEKITAEEGEENEGINKENESEMKEENSKGETEEKNVECDETKDVSEDKEVIEEMIKEQVVVKEDICVKAKAYVTTSGDENKEEDGSKKKVEVDEEKKDEVNKAEERQGEKIEEIKNENEESSNISSRETSGEKELSEKVKDGLSELESPKGEGPQKEDSEFVESRSASQCTTRRLSSDNLRSKEENLISNEEKVEGNEEVENDLLIKEEEKGEELKSETEEIPKAEVVTDAIQDEKLEDKKEYHIYVPDSNESQGSSSDTSTFTSAATKIQAGVRGFLTRRRLQSTQCRSSTLDSVPSIQESFVVEPGTITESLLSPIEEVTQAATTIQNNYRRYNARKRLRREDAIQRTTLSLENAFSANGLQHTGEFHDCVPLPVFELTRKDFRKKKSPGSSEEKEKEGSEKEGGDKIGDDENRGIVGKDTKEGGNKRGGTNNGKDQSSERDKSTEGGEKDKSDRTEGKAKKEGTEKEKGRDKIKDEENRGRDKVVGKDIKVGGNNSAGTNNGTDRNSERDKSTESGEKDESDETEGKAKKEATEKEKGRDKIEDEENRGKDKVVGKDTKEEGNKSGGTNNQKDINSGRDKNTESGEKDKSDGTEGKTKKEGTEKEKGRDKIEHEENRGRDKVVGKDTKEEGNKSGGTNNRKDLNSGRDISTGSRKKDERDGTERKAKKEGLEKEKGRDTNIERDEDDNQEGRIKNEGKDSGREENQGNTLIGDQYNFKETELNKIEEVKNYSGPQKSTHPGMNCFPQEEIHFPSDLPNGYPQPELGNIFLKQPDFHLGLNPKIGPIVDFLLLSKEESMLQNSYLNFITSVEDEMNSPDVPKVESEKNLGVDNPCDSGESISIREPLALPGTPTGVVIEEITSLDETMKSISGSISLDEEDGILRTETSKEEDNVEEGKEEKMGVEEKHNFLESFEEDEREKKGGGDNAEGVNKIEEEGRNINTEEEKREEQENGRESSTSLDDREFLESSPISLDDPTSPETTRISSAKKKIRDVSRKDEISHMSKEEIQEPPLVNLKEEFREEGPLLKNVVGELDENGAPSFNGKGENSSPEEKVKSSSLSGEENSSRNGEGDSALRKETNSFSKEEEGSTLREESHFSPKEEERFSLMEETNSSSKDKEPASITNKKGPSSSEDHPSFKDDLPNIQDSSLVPDASLSTLSFSMNIEDVLGLGSEDENCKEFRKPNLQINYNSASFGTSQDSQNSESIGRLESPVTMMQIVPNSLEDKSRSLEEDKAFGSLNGVKDFKEEIEETKEDKGTGNSKETKFKELKEKASPKENESDSSEKSSKERRKVLGK